MSLSNLNAEQFEAACAPFGYNLIIASAGTGKTSTIVGRIAYLFSQNVLPEEILLLTFTNKAAEEMIDRVARKFGEKMAKGILAGTFHAIAYKYLQKYHIVLKQPRELKVLFKSIAQKHVYAPSQASPYSPQYLYDLYSLYLNAQRHQSFEEWLLARNPDQECYMRIYEGILEEFSALKKAYRYVDFNDLLLYFREDMLQKSSPYVEILCDEYQDTNPLQDSILDSLKPKSLFCVGDYDQSIYAFNGADIKIIANFTKKYADARVFTLSKNYRSSAGILDLANRVIRKNERIYPKHLEVMKTQSHEMPRLLVYEELFLQYQGIAKRIASGSKDFEKIAIIFRNNISADGCEASLRELGIPSKRKGGASFFDSQEIALLLDICAFVYNPKDMMAFIHVLGYGHQIGSSVAKDIYEALENLGEGDIKKGILHPLSKKRAYALPKQQRGLFDDLLLEKSLEKKTRFDEFLDPVFASHPILAHPRFDKDSALFLQDFYHLFSALQSSSKPTRMLDQIAASAFYLKIKEMLVRQRIKNKDGSLNFALEEVVKERIQRKILLLREVAEHYELIGTFLNAMILGSSEATQGSGVNLLSIHASKGLEFDEVYVIDLMQGRFPNLKLIQKGGSLEEERRLFYVAVTRAKERLFLSYARRDALKNIDYEPSVFLYEAGLEKKE